MSFEAILAENNIQVTSSGALGFNCSDLTVRQFLDIVTAKTDVNMAIKTEGEFWTGLQSVFKFTNFGLLR